MKGYKLQLDLNMINMLKSPYWQQNQLCWNLFYE